ARNWTQFSERTGRRPASQLLRLLRRRKLGNETHRNAESLQLIMWLEKSDGLVVTGAAFHLAYINAGFGQRFRRQRSLTGVFRRGMNVCVNPLIQPPLALIT